LQPLVREFLPQSQTLANNAAVADNAVRALERITAQGRSG
jgi:hypothetical protein